MNRLSLSILGACCLVLAVSGVADPGTGRCGELDPDAIVIRSSLRPGYAEATAEAVIAGNVESVWAVLTDYEHLSEYMPTVRECRVLERSGDLVRLHYVIGYFIFTTAYTVELREENKNRQTWRIVDGPFGINRGSWTLEPAGGGRTKLAYHVRISHNVFPDRLLLRILTNQLPGLFRAIEERVEK